MSKEILTLGDTKLKKFSFTAIRPLFFLSLFKRCRYRESISI